MLINYNYHRSIPGAEMRNEHNDRLGLILDPVVNKEKKSELFNCMSSKPSGAKKKNNNRRSNTVSASEAHGKHDKSPRLCKVHTN